MGPVALRGLDGLHEAVLVKFDDGLGQVEVDGAALDSLAVEDLGQLVHEVEVFGERAVFLADAFISLVGYRVIGPSHPRTRNTGAFWGPRPSVHRTIGGGSAIFLCLYPFVSRRTHPLRRMIFSRLCFVVAVILTPPFPQST